MQKKFIWLISLSADNLHDVFYSYNIWLYPYLCRARNVILKRSLQHVVMLNVTEKSVLSIAEWNL